MTPVQRYRITKTNVPTSRYGNGGIKRRKNDKLSHIITVESRVVIPEMLKREGWGVSRNLHLATTTIGKCLGINLTPSPFIPIVSWREGTSPPARPIHHFHTEDMLYIHYRRRPDKWASGNNIRLLTFTRNSPERIIIIVLVVGAVLAAGVREE